MLLLVVLVEVMMELTLFFFSIYKGQYSNNFMEALAIKIILEEGFSLR